ncbi:MAG: hypothetical protein K6F27_06225 [Ruminococcus sp.]|nr:hypothetical protein [Ruminococcus sp.]
MPKYKMRYMFDWGSGVCFWSNSNETRVMFGDYPIEELEKLPISDDLVRELVEEFEVEFKEKWLI